MRQEWSAPADEGLTSTTAGEAMELASEHAQVSSLFASLCSHYPYWPPLEATNAGFRTINSVSHRRRWKIYNSWPTTSILPVPVLMRYFACQYPTVPTANPTVFYRGFKHKALQEFQAWSIWWTSYLQNIENLQSRLLENIEFCHVRVEHSRTAPIR